MTTSKSFGRQIVMDVEMHVQLRTTTGTGAARRLRRRDAVPAILYGPKTAPVPLAVPAIRLLKLLREMGEESKLIRLMIGEGESQQVRQALIREVQTHPVRRRFVHVDFYEVPLDQPIVVEVPVELDGESIGEKKGGVLDLIRRTLAVRCLPGEIPERIHIDISNLDLGSSIHVGDLVDRVPFELVDDTSFAVVAVAVPEEMTKAAEGAEEEPA
jgi:large subunit ribosomal protein L25